MATADLIIRAADVGLEPAELTVIVETVDVNGASVEATYDGRVLARTLQASTDSDGELVQTLPRTTDLSPSGTCYAVTVGNHRRVILLTDDVNLAAATQPTPGPVPPAQIRTTDLADWSDEDPEVGQTPVWDGTDWTPGTPEGGGAVDSVNGQTGIVVLGASDVGAASTAALAAESTARSSADTALGQALIDHAADTTSVHGIADTAQLVTQTALSAEATARATADGLRVLKAGDTMSGALGMAGNAITDLPNPTNAQDPATRAWVLSQLPSLNLDRGIYGNGADGDVVINSTVSLTRDMVYRNLTIQSGGILNTAGCRVYVQQTCNVMAGGTMRSNGGAGAAGGTAGSAASGLVLGGGGAAGAGGATTGTAGSTSINSGGGAAGAGGAGTSGAGGAAGGATAMAAAQGTLRAVPQSAFGFAVGNSAITPFRGGGGGGGGGGDGTAGGGGGGGGGVLTLAARDLIIDGAIQAHGGAGGTPAAGNRGGGGGGGGGLVSLTYSTKSGSGTITASGGAGGSPSGTGVAGAAGSAGTVVEVVASALAGGATGNGTTTIVNTPDGMGLTDPNPGAYGRLRGPWSVMSSPPTVTFTADGASPTITGATIAPSDSLYLYLSCHAAAAPADAGYWLANNVADHNVEGYFTTVEFMTDAADYEVSLKNAGSSPKYKVWVDDQPATATANAGTSYTTGGWMKLAFGSRAIRRVRLELFNYKFGGVRRGTTSTVWRPHAPRGPRVVVIGDSVTAGAEGDWPLSSWVQYMAWSLGWRDVYNAGIGSSGFTAGTVNTVFTARYTSDVTQWAPDIVLVAGGANDNAASAGAMTTATAAVFGGIRAALPDAKIIALGTWPNRSTVHDSIIFAAADAVDSVLNIETNAWIYGTGRVGATTGDGNADLYIANGPHLAEAGAAYVGRRVAAAIAAAMPL